MKRYRTVFIIVGLLILLVMFCSFGVEKTIDDMIALGWNFWIVVGIFLFNNIFMAYGWKVLINQDLPPSYFTRLVLARIAGDSTSSVNAVASIAGEALKAMYIKDRVPFKVGLASVVMDRTVHTIANILMVLTGIFISFFVLNIPLVITAITFTVFAAALALMIAVLKKQKEGFVDYLLHLLPEQWLGKFMTEKRWHGVGVLDDEIGYIFSSRRNMRNFYISLGIHFLSGLLISSLEIYLIIVFSGNTITFMHSMFLYVFSMFLTGFVFFMPANLGTSEGSLSIALKFLGYDPAMGLTVGLIRRLRSFVWSGIGIVILLYAGLIKKDTGIETEKPGR